MDRIQGDNPLKRFNTWHTSQVKKDETKEQVETEAQNKKRFDREVAVFSKDLDRLMSLDDTVKDEDRRPGNVTTAPEEPHSSMGGYKFDTLKKTDEGFTMQVHRAGRHEDVTDRYVVDEASQTIAVFREGTGRDVYGQPTNSSKSFTLDLQQGMIADEKGHTPR